MPVNRPPLRPADAESLCALPLIPLIGVCGSAPPVCCRPLPTPRGRDRADVIVKRSCFRVADYAASARAGCVRCLALLVLPVFHAVQAPRLAVPAQPPLSKPFHPQAGSHTHCTTNEPGFQNRVRPWRGRKKSRSSRSGYVFCEIRDVPCGRIPVRGGGRSVLRRPAGKREEASRAACASRRLARSPAGVTPSPIFPRSGFSECRLRFLTRRHAMAGGTLTPARNYDRMYRFARRTFAESAFPRRSRRYPWRNLTSEPLSATFS
jgi:hypothetical protein